MFPWSGTPGPSTASLRRVETGRSRGRRAFFFEGGVSAAVSQMKNLLRLAYAVGPALLEDHVHERIGGRRFPCSGIAHAAEPRTRLARVAARFDMGHLVHEGHEAAAERVEVINGGNAHGARHGFAEHGQAATKLRSITKRGHLEKAVKATVEVCRKAGGATRLARSQSYSTTHPNNGLNDPEHNERPANFIHCGNL